MDIDQIKKDCQRRLKSASEKTRVESGKIIEDSFQEFYSQGSPKRQRTYTLPGSKYVTMESSGDMCHIEAGYEGDQISYSDGTFSGGEVLGATMTGTYNVKGDPSYDDNAFEEIIRTADKIFAQEFGN